MKLSLSQKQLEMMQKVVDDPQVVEALIGGSAGGAKTASICIAILTAGTKYPGLQVALGRKTLQALNRSTVATLLGKIHPLFGITENDFRYSIKDNVIEYKNGSKITLLPLDYEPSDPDFARLGSLEFDWGFVDEAGEISLEAKNVLRSRLGRGIATEKFGIKPLLVLGCNPSINFLRPEYYEPYRKLGGGAFQKWPIGEIYGADGKKMTAYRAFMRMGVQDNPFISRNYIETLKQLPERERKRLLDGDWDYADNDRMLFTGELIDDVTIYSLPEMEMMDRYDYLIGVDVADVGNDSSVISIVQNNILIKQKEINLKESGIGKNSKVDVGDFLATKIINQAQTLGLTSKDAKRITIEVNGVGASLRDALRRKQWFVNEYVADVNSRGALYYSLRELMMDGKVKILNSRYIDYVELRRELNAHEYDMEGKNIHITNKKNLRKLLGRSPDLSDSFAIALYPRGGAMPLVEPKKINYFAKIHL